MKLISPKLAFSALSLAFISSLGPVISSAEAAIIDWDYSFASSWINPGLPSVGSGFVGGIGTSTISWGAQAGNPTVIANPQSSLNISDNSGVVTTFFGPGTPTPTSSFFEPVGTITHTNKVIALNSSITGVTLKSTLNLTPKTPAGSLASLDANFLVNFEETPNSGGCLPTSVSQCDDIFVLKSIVLDPSGLNIVLNPATQVVDDQLSIALPLPSPPFPNHDLVPYTYFLNIGDPLSTVPKPGVLRVLTPEECMKASASEGCIGFTTEEDKATPVPLTFAIGIDKKGVPEPSSAAALVGAGLVSFALLRKRKQHS